MQARKIINRKGCLIVLAAFAALFLLWRFVRPLNIFVVDERFERPMAIELPQGLKSVSASECQGCHEEIAREWAGSMHAKAWTEPYFQVDYAFDGSQQICLNCHTPLADQQPDLVLGFKDRDKFRPIQKPNPAYDPALRDEGVTCAVCHIRNGKIVGPFKTGNAPHPVEYDPELASGMKPCERCHVVFGNRWDTFYAIPPCGTVVEIEQQGQKQDCIGCHMPPVTRPVAKGGPPRKGRRHLFRGGHDPETVARALKVEHIRTQDGYRFTLTNVGASHFLPTGTPDRHLTLEARLMSASGEVIREKTYTMKRYILWRPFITDLEDTRLPYGVPRTYDFRFKASEDMQGELDVTVRYHLLDEARRKRIGYENKEPIAYPVYHARVPVAPGKPY
jgi:mono/diheme cytochrome c family protein